MNRNRTTDPSMKQSSISSISSNVPLMTTTGGPDIHLPTQSMTSGTTNVQSFLDSMKMNNNRDSKRARAIVQPKGTIPHTVGPNDTLEKIALHYNLTPSELIHLNKLHSRIVFPGQVLYVPETTVSTSHDKSSAPPPPSLISPSSSTKAKDADAFILLSDRRLSGESSPPPTSGQQQQQDIGHMVWSMGRQTAAKPGRAQRLKSEPSVDSELSPRSIEDRLRTQKEDNTKQVQHIQRGLSIDESRQLDEECLQRFLKVNVRLMTEDRKNIAGTLLVTPNAVMFDPDVLDPAVKENGIEKYGLIIRMDHLAGIAVYEDIAMYEHEASLRDEEKRRMCHSVSVKHFQQSPTKIIEDDEGQIRELMTSILDRIEKNLDPSASTTDPPVILFNASTSIHRSLSLDAPFHSTSSYDADDLFQSLDDLKHSTGVLVEDKTTIPPFPQVCQLENCAPVEDFSKRFDEIDKLLQKQHEIYVTPHPIEIPYYMCIKTSRHRNDLVTSTSSMSEDDHSRKELDVEYWFSVPKEKIDHLYAFFLRWSPERDNDSPPRSDQLAPTVPSTSSTKKQNEKSTAKGFVLLSNDDVETTEELLLTENKNNQSCRERTLTSTSSDSGKEPKKSHYLKRQNTLLKEWEIINVDEIYRRINATQANNARLDDIYALPAPTLLQPSTLINEHQSKEILLELPARVHGLNWQLLFSTEMHGFSLNQLYRRALESDSDAPSLLIVRDIEQNIFGAYVSQQIMISEGFYGTGESFLFTFHPQFQVFKWTGNNQFFVKGDVKALGIGCGEGIYGLWLDSDLNHGRTNPSKTFNNARLSSKEDFIVASVEVWTFID